jgi:hypothetical protein
VQVGDLVKYHSAGRAPKIITVLEIVRQHGHEWARGLEIGDTKQRLYDIEHCEVISASR